MKRLLSLIIPVFIFIVLVPSGLFSGVDIKDTKFLSQPAFGNDHVAFVYAGDLWVAETDGTNVRRLTSDEGIEFSPAFSPDGKTIAFSAQYDGNTDVFVVGVDGGVPKRLTWHPYPDTVQGFSPDGSSVLFTSARFVFTGRYQQLFTVPISGDYPKALNIPNAAKATYSPDGKRMAYTPLSEPFRQWKNYRGGTVTTIWIITFSDSSVVKIPQPEGRCNDTDPIWIDNEVFFLSDRNGEFNLFSYAIGSQEIKQLTQHEDFPILSASGNKGKIVYEQAGHIHVYDVQNGQSDRLKIGIAADLMEVRPRFVSGSQYVRSASISPTGARAVLGFRGEIITVPAEKGDPRNLTNSTSSHERYPEWSPDGKNIAYVSDESGEYELHIKQHDGKGAAKKIKLIGEGFYNALVWSPDSKKITYTDNARTLYWVDLESGKIKKVAAEYHFGVGDFGPLRGAWSPDSKWIAYTLESKSYIRQVFVYSLEQEKSFAITDGLSDVTEPAFDKNGEYIYFFASTDAGPVKHWFAMSNADMSMTRAIYLATLRKDIISPLAKESDEEKIEEKKKEKAEEKEKAEKSNEDKKKEPPFSIDFEGLNNRIISLPIPRGNYTNLQVGDEGQLFFMEIPPANSGPDAAVKLHKYDLKKQKDDVIVSRLNGYVLSFDKKMLLYFSRRAFSIVPATSPAKPGQGALNIDAIQVRIDPRKEWQQMFDESWRINRDYFYADNMHGADWDAMKTKYEKFLPHLASRSDLNRLIQWMCSELSVGHHRVGGGDFMQSPPSVAVGLLGADYSIENNRYRFKKIYGGLNWNPQLRSPLTEPGVNVNAGDYLLAVNGKELYSKTNLFSLFETTPGKIIEIKVGISPDGKDSRTYNVVPVSTERNIRNRDWVEGNIKKVDKATNGRVAYVYVPNTTGLGHVYFKRYFFPQSHKDAIIIDERFNGGGQVADYYIDLLRRPLLCYWRLSYGADIKTPSASIQGPKVMLIDETAGSGGDLLPWMFRKLKMGKLIGKRTWGGLVGNVGAPVLLDGGRVTAPNIAIWTEEEGWIVENVGIPPDIEVEQWPADVNAGRDPQLEKAIEVILEELKKNPPKQPKRPPYPIRVRKK